MIRPTLEGVTPLSVESAQERLGLLVQQAAVHGQRAVISPGSGHPTAVIVGAEELADHEDALAVARYQVEKATGTLRTTPHTEVLRRLGLTTE